MSQSSFFVFSAFLPNSEHHYQTKLHQHYTLDAMFCWTVILAATTCWEAVKPRVGTMHYSTLIVSIQKEESISIYKQLKSRGWCTQQSKATCSLFLIKMIAKLERTQKTAQQNMEQPQTPPPHTHNGYNNNNLVTLWVGGTATDPPPPTHTMGTTITT